MTFTRDALGNVVERRSAAEVTTFQWDPMRRLRRAVNGDAELELARDPLGRVLAETVNGRTVRSEFDAAGRRVRRTTPTGAETSWEYDANHRPTALHSGGHTMTFGYDEVGREVQRLLDTGTILAQTWDPDHRLTSQTISTVAGAPAATTAWQATVIQRRDYRYRSDGYLAEIEDQLVGTRRFELDTAGRVTDVRTTGGIERYAYDPAGNVVAAAWPSDDTTGQGIRQFDGTLLESAGQVSYRHDRQGRVVLRQKKRLSAKPDTWHYTWDAEDRLVEVSTPDGSRWRYRYDPLGRRIAKQRLGPGGETVAEQVDFVWDGTVLAEQVRNGSTATTWNWEPGRFRPVAQVERRRAGQESQEWVDARFYSIVTDLVGMPTELVDEGGNLAWRQQTTLWGEALSRIGREADIPFRFPGQYFDAETGLHYNYHRYYDPTTGRYITHDPLGLAPSPNTQGYVRNPTGWIDPFGLAENCDFPNQKPEDFDAEMEVARRNGVTPTTPGTPEFDAMIAAGDGQVKWVVLPNGELRVAPHSVNGEEVSHAVVAGGGPVRAAGQANVAGSADAGYLGWTSTTTVATTCTGQTTTPMRSSNRALTHSVGTASRTRGRGAPFVGLVDVLDEMRSWDGERQRAALLSARPDGPDRTNWWLGAVQHTALRATHPETPRAEVPDWARLTVLALDTAHAEGDLDAREVAVCKANLATVLSRFGDPAEFSPALRPDDIARELLALAEISPDEAAATPWELTAEDVPTMRRLRKVRNVIAPAVQLIDKVTDEETRQRLAQWRDVLPKLP